MNKALIGIFSIVLVMGIALGANTGAFGEVASLNACHCLMFNSTNRTHVWTLYSSFNTSLQFSIVKPDLANIIITTSVTNGTIQPNSYYPINVTVVSNSPVNQSGYISAYAVGNAIANTGGASVRLGTQKLLEIAANSTLAAQAQQSGNSGQSTVASTTIQSTQNKNAASTTIQSMQNNNSSIQSAGGGAAALSVSAVIPYLILAIVLLLVVVCALLYKITRKRSSVNSFRKKKPVRRKR